MSTYGNLSLVRDIKVGGRCYGVCHKDKHIYVICQTPANLKVFKENGTAIKSVHLDRSDANYIAVTLTSNGPTVYVSYKDTRIDKIEMNNNFVSKQTEVVTSVEGAGVVSIGCKWLVLCSILGGHIYLLAGEESKLPIVKKWTRVKISPRAIDFCPPNILYVSYESQFLCAYQLST